MPYPESDRDVAPATLPARDTAIEVTLPDPSSPTPDATHHGVIEPAGPFPSPFVFQEITL